MKILLQITLVLMMAMSPAVVIAQSPSPEAIDQFQDAVATRVELLLILGGHHGASEAVFTFSANRGGLKIYKLGDRGDISDPRPLGKSGLRWNIVLEGTGGYTKTENTFEDGILKGNETEFESLALHAGAGARLHFTEHLSSALTVGLLYGQVENDFNANNSNGERFEDEASGKFVNWSVDTLSVVPNLDLLYRYTFGSTEFKLSSTYMYFQTEQLSSSSDYVEVSGSSGYWENKVDADVRLPWKLWRNPIHTGGYFSRSDMFGTVRKDLDSSSFYTAEGRLILADFLPSWKVNWLGLGAVYFWSKEFSGWALSIKLRLSL